MAPRRKSARSRGGGNEAAVPAAQGSAAPITTTATPPLDCFRGTDAAGLVDRLSGLLEDPTVFLTASQEVSAVAKGVTKALFDYAARGSEESAGLPSCALPELHVDGFDTEQIWLQLDMGLDSALKQSKRLLKRAGPLESLMSSEDVAEDAEGREEEEGQEDFQGDSASEEEEGTRSDEEEALGEPDEVASDSEADEGEDEELGKPAGGAGEGGDDALQPGEDQFFRFSDMDNFLQDAEDEAARSDQGEEDEDEEGDGSDEEEEEEELDEEEMAELMEGGSDSGDDTDVMGAKGAKYSDLFGKAEQGGDKGGKASLQRRTAGQGSEENLSSFEVRQRKIMQKIEELEESAVGVKNWDMQGEVTAKSRPLNSVLEAELDFETGVRGATEVAEDVAESIDDLIRKRCIEGRFDDVIRIAAPPPEKKKVVIELDDTKSSAGLGELYEKDYVRAATGGAVQDKEEPLRQEAKQLFGELCGKLDALSHFHYTPKPVVEELEVRAEVPALAMEEALPTAASTASLKAPEEAYKPSSVGDLKAEEELTKAERKAVRAKRKRVTKRKRAEKDASRKARAVSAGGEAPVAGRKSEAEAKAASRGVRKGQRSEFVKSTGVFSKLQAQQDALKAGISLDKKAPKEKSAAQFKL